MIKDNDNRVQRGQALVIIAVGMVALIALSGLAIDGGNAYSDRRHAQNAADTSVMAAGLTKIRNAVTCQSPSDPVLCSVARTAGIDRAADNGYVTNGSSTVVNVYQCSDPAAACNLPPPEPFNDANGNGVHDANETYTELYGNDEYDLFDPKQYLQVTITSVIPTYLARVVGITELTNSVEAIARADPPMPLPLYDGRALVATMPGCTDWPHDPFTLGGSSATLLTGAGGVFVNSTCDDAFTANGGTTIDSVAGICVVGGAVVSNLATVNADLEEDCGEQISSDYYQPPQVTWNVSCPTAGQYYDIGGGNYLASPGYYTSPFPAIPPSGNLKLQKGIYCLDDGLSQNASGSMTTDLDDNGTVDGSDGAQEGVMFYVRNGDVTFNGTSLVKIGAMNSEDVPIGVRGYLLYLPETNDSTVTITGSNGSTFVGIILAPASHIILNGGAGGDHLDLETQIIGYSIEVTGSGTLDVEYNQGAWNTTWTNPLLALFR
jgi:hypothetical protein